MKYEMKITFDKEETDDIITVTGDYQDTEEMIDTYNGVLSELIQWAYKIEYVKPVNEIPKDNQTGLGITLTDHDDVNRDEDGPRFPVVGSNYPNGPCSLPIQCTCGTIITQDNIEMNNKCTSDCEICKYCSSAKCPDCGEHVCCGGCV